MVNDNLVFIFLIVFKDFIYLFRARERLPMGMGEGGGQGISSRLTERRAGLSVTGSWPELKARVRLLTD